MFLIVIILSLLGTPANADNSELRWKMASRDICVQTATSVDGWHLGQAIKAWNATGHVNMYQNVTCPMDSNIITVTQDYYNNPEWRGLTSFLEPADSYDGTTLVYSDVYIQLDRSDYERSKNQWRIKCSFWRTMAHELGHAIGIQHQDHLNSVMNTTIEAKYGKNCMKLTSTDAWLASQIGY